MAINSDFVSKSRSMRQKQERRRNCFAVGTWNVPTLVESTGDERVCRKRRSVLSSLVTSVARLTGSYT